MKKSFLICLLLIANLLNYGQVPPRINFNAILEDENGHVVPDGFYPVNFSIFGPDGQLWEELDTVEVQKGVVNTVMGFKKPIMLPFNEPYALKMALAGVGPVPNIPLTTSPYSFTSRSVIDGAITGPKIADGNVVRSVNLITDHVIISEGKNIHISYLGHSIILSAELDSIPSGLPALIAGDGLMASSDNSKLKLMVPMELIGETAALPIISAINKGGANGIEGIAQSGYGVFGKSIGGGSGILGSDQYGVWGQYGFMKGHIAGPSYGVFGEDSASGNYGYIASGDHAVYGEAEEGSAIEGLNASYGHSGGLGTEDFGAYGKHNSGNSGYLGTNSQGVKGVSPSQFGVWGESTSGEGIHGKSKNSTGIFGESEEYTGIYGASTASYGVGATNTTSNNAAFLGGTDQAIYCYSNIGGTGITAVSNGGYAARLQGDVQVSGTLYKGGGAFEIDHPLDPENKYLLHSFVESPDMMNIYNGNEVLDENGEAIVELPDWFEALNQDFRYQLTCIGGYAPVYIAEEISGNHFKIAGGSEGLKISWQVTGIRHDKFAENHRIPTEKLKTKEEQGKYMYPKEFGQPESKGIMYETNQRNLELNNRMKNSIQSK